MLHPARIGRTKGYIFFVDDYQFIRLWNDPDRYMPMLQQFRYVLTPDFSLYTDFPKALQIWNHYRKHWIGAYMQMYLEQQLHMTGLEKGE